PKAARGLDWRGWRAGGDLIESRPHGIHTSIRGIAVCGPAWGMGHAAGIDRSGRRVGFRELDGLGTWTHCSDPSTSLVSKWKPTTCERIKRGSVPINRAIPMQINTNTTGMEAGLTVATDKDGRDHCVVVVKGTFAVGPDGECRLAELQEPLVVADV